MTLQEQHQKEFTDELVTIRDILRWTVTKFEENDLFYGHGTDNPWDEAIALILYFLKLSNQNTIENLNILLDSRVTHSEKMKLYNILAKRINERMPLPYLTNQAWFCGLEFYVDQNVLIPRSPVAELIESNFEPWLNLRDDLSILEIGTGSGCIAVAMAESLYETCVDLNIDATDISDKALEIANKNIHKHGFEEFVNLIKSDLFENIDNKYDLIISNPPYVDAKEMDELPAEFRHEPTGALAAGPDGLDIVDRILKQSYDYLNDNGILIVEVGISSYALEEKYPNVEFIWFDFENGGEGVFLLTKEQLKNIG